MSSRLEILLESIRQALKNNEIVQVEGEDEREIGQNPISPLDLKEIENDLEEIQKYYKALELDVARLNLELIETRMLTFEAQKAGRYYGDYWRDLVLMSEGIYRNNGNDEETGQHNDPTREDIDQNESVNKSAFEETTFNEESSYNHGRFVPPQRP